MAAPKTGYFLDTDEQLRSLQLSRLAGEHCDIVMLVEFQSGVVQSESPREFEDGNPRLEVLGFTFGAQWNSKETGGSLQPKKLWVVRRCDAATASLLGNFPGSPTEGRSTNRVLKRVLLSVFKAGGESKTKDMQPVIDIELMKPQISSIDVLTSKKFEYPHEIISFIYASLKIQSAPQIRTGQRGAVRIASISGQFLP
jgi:hypothetical protein